MQKKKQKYKIELIFNINTLTHNLPIISLTYKQMYDINFDSIYSDKSFVFLDS